MRRYMIERDLPGVGGLSTDQLGDTVENQEAAREHARLVGLPATKSEQGEIARRSTHRERRPAMKRATLLAATILLVACGGDGYGVGGPDDDDDNGGGGPVGTVSVGSGIEFVSRHNGTANPAVDTIAVGGAVTWTWRGSLPHNVRSVGATAFTSSDIRTGSGTHVVTFTTPGTYRYDCAVHGQAMTGTVVVTGEAGAAEIKQAVADSTGDTFGTGGFQWDLTSLTVLRDTAGVTVMLDFATDVVSPMSGDQSALIAFVDLDIDQNPTTGAIAVVDEFRLDGGSTDLGVDALVNLGIFAADSTVGVTDPLGVPMGRVKPVYDGNRVTIRIPRSVIGNDDGFMNVAAIVGTTAAPSDIVPEQGHLTLGEAALAAAARVTTQRRSATGWVWRSR